MLYVQPIVRNLCTKNDISCGQYRRLQRLDTYRLVHVCDDCAEFGEVTTQSVVTRLAVDTRDQFCDGLWLQTKH